MASIVRTSNSKMQCQRGKSPGWAAFDRKQRDKRCTEPGCGVDPFPPVSVAQGPKHTVNNCSSTRSFSSVIRPPMDFPSIMQGVKGGNLDDCLGRKPANDVPDQIACETNALPSIKSLKSIHVWADQSLIEDILAAVNNDEEQASEILKAMVSNDFHEEVELQESSTTLNTDTFGEKDECPGPSICLDNESSEEPWKELASINLLSAPIEPEWEEDDIYLSCRKDAIRMMRSASQHSRAASNAFQRGDHLSARQLSLKAQEEWISAEKLNAKAAEEILHIRNSNNDVWKLDLHGLHASEAVNILKEHLRRIESHASIKCSVSADVTYKLEKGAIPYPSCVSDGGLDMTAQSGKEKALLRQRQTVLHVVTGTGNHSRGQAALPTAVRSFLIENGYRFDDVRPGVLAVRPRFRHS